MQEYGWRDGGFPNEDGQLAVYVGETRGMYEVAWHPSVASKPEYMLSAESYGSSACAQTTLCPLPAVDWDSCIVGEGLLAVWGLYAGNLVVAANGGGV